MIEDSLATLYVNHPMHDHLHLDLTVKKGESTLAMDVHPSCLNLVGTLHGSLYFKLMDDACFFAALSMNHHAFVATATFTIHYFTPVSSGRLTAKASVVEQMNSKYMCECVIVDQDTTKIGYGSGLFVAPKVPLSYTQDLLKPLP